MKLATILLACLGVFSPVLGDMYYSNIPHLRPHARFEVTDTLRLNCAAQNCTMPLHGSTLNGTRRQRGWKRPVTREPSIVQMHRHLKLSRSESPPLGNHDE
jgi:hypothetical protein